MHEARREKKRNFTGFWRGNPQERTFGRRRDMLEDNINIYLKPTECEGAELICVVAETHGSLLCTQQGTFRFQNAE